MARVAKFIGYNAIPFILSALTFYYTPVIGTSVPEGRKVAIIVMLSFAVGLVIIGLFHATRYGIRKLSAYKYIIKMHYDQQSNPVGAGTMIMTLKSFLGTLQNNEVADLLQSEFDNKFYDILHYYIDDNFNSNLLICTVLDTKVLSMSQNLTENYFSVYHNGQIIGRAIIHGELDGKLVLRVVHSEGNWVDDIRGRCSSVGIVEDLFGYKIRFNKPLPNVSLEPDARRELIALTSQYINDLEERLRRGAN